MAETLLASGAAERSGGDSYQVIVHVDVDGRPLSPGPNLRPLDPRVD